MIPLTVFIGVLAVSCQATNGWGPPVAAQMGPFRPGHVHNNNYNGYGFVPHPVPDETYIHPPWMNPNMNNLPVDPEFTPNLNKGPFGYQRQVTTDRTPPFPGLVTEPETVPTSSIPSITYIPSTTESVGACRRRCAVTTEYNPVCGTDNVSYDNMGRFECARSCGANIQILKMGQCNANGRSFNQIDILRCVKDCKVKKEYSPVCGTNLVTYANIERLDCARRCGVDVKLDRMTACQAVADVTHETTRVEVDICLELCPIKNNLDPICGSNGVSYINREHIGCAQKCGHNVAYSRNGLCEVEPPTPSPPVTEQKCIETSSQPPQPSSTEAVKIQPPTAAELAACMQKCALTMEYNPVCGTDGITYNNPGLLLCNQFCGVDVQVKKFASCSSNAPSNVFECPATKPDTNQALFQFCMNSCTVPANFDLVCGSNGVTYKNEDELFCAKRCGVEVTLLYKRSCSDAGSVTGSPVTQPTNTGSSETPPTPTYTPPTEPTRTGPPPTQPTPTGSPVTQPTPTGSTGTGSIATTPDYHGVDPNILFNVFPEMSTPSTNTGDKGTPPTNTIDNSEEYDIDERYQTATNKTF